MTEKHKRPARDLLRSAAQILPNLGSTEPSRGEEAIGEFWEFLPHIERILSALLRGLNSGNEDVREQAAKGLLLAFPSTDAGFSRLLGDIVESGEPKVRLAAIERVIIILANDLAALSGMKPNDKPPNPVMEGLMEHPGQWIAWSRDRQRMLAVADSFTDVMAQALEAGESDPYVKKAPGVSPQTTRKPFAILEDESPNIIDDIRKVFPAPEAWLDAPNAALGGEKPGDLIGTDREWEVRYLLRGIEDGITT